MYNYVNLLVYNKGSTNIGQKVDSILNSLPFSFISLDTFEGILSKIQEKNCYVLVVVHNINIYNTLKNINFPANTCDKFIVIYSINRTPIPKFTNYYTCNNLDEIKSTLMSLNPIAIPSFIQKMVRIELEKLNLSKKYLAFKYLVDTICHSLYTGDKNTFSTNTLSYIALINNTSWNSIERDIRHMLTSNWNSNETFKSAICKHISGTEINTKILVDALISYIKEYN